mmetsp:Transcript_66850/g.211554  ORF Transcript_66850/g.211554 Transcript_66850/m.211554 type:complete len:211 (-) Transcript_66850:1736-2368(-)
MNAYWRKGVRTDGAMARTREWRDVSTTEGLSRRIGSPSGKSRMCHVSLRPPGELETTLASRTSFLVGSTRSWARGRMLTTGARPLSPVVTRIAVWRTLTRPPLEAVRENLYERPSAPPCSRARSTPRGSTAATMSSGAPAASRHCPEVSSGPSHAHAKRMSLGGRASPPSLGPASASGSKEEVGSSFSSSPSTSVHAPPAMSAEMGDSTT